jgi:hypothetical protein
MLAPSTLQELEGELLAPRTSAAGGVFLCDKQRPWPSAFGLELNAVPAVSQNVSEQHLLSPPPKNGCNRCRYRCANANGSVSRRSSEG